MKLRPDIRKVSELYRVIMSTEEIARNLGFDPQSLPGYETIRHFINDLLDDETMEHIFYREVKAIGEELNCYGETLGEETLEDATIITAKRGDPEAEYNFHLLPWSDSYVIKTKIYSTDLWKKWSEAVNASGGIYKYRWGDNELMSLFYMIYDDKPMYNLKTVENGYHDQGMFRRLQSTAPGVKDNEK